MDLIRSPGSVGASLLGGGCVSIQRWSAAVPDRGIAINIAARGSSIAVPFCGLGKNKTAEDIPFN